MDPTVNRRGFILILSLLLILLLLILGLSFLGTRAAQYRRAALSEAALAARALAEAGLEDFRVKIERDIDFPPLTEDREVFSYTQELQDTAAGTRLGAFTVQVDGTYRKAPYALFVVTSVGEIGPEASQAGGRRALRAEFNLDPNRPDFYRFINLQDLGSL